MSETRQQNMPISALPEAASVTGAELLPFATLGANGAMTVERLAAFIRDGYASKSEVDTRIKSIIGTAPEAFDTLGEIASALAQDDDAIDAINGVLALKATKEELQQEVSKLSTALANAESRIQALETKMATIPTIPQADNCAYALINGNWKVIAAPDEAIAVIKTEATN